MAMRKRPTDQRPAESDDEGRAGASPSSDSVKRTRVDFVYDQNDKDKEDQQFEQLSAIVSKASKVTPEKNTPASGGIVTRIQCENFMCHDNLIMKLGPLTNFVVGHNGSGKSAVLTAFSLCMGGKAAGTNRAASIKGLIKTGKDWARITVVLKNEGDGFKQKEYGDEIRVVRWFNATGGGGYKLQSKTGKTISSKREDLDELCDFYGIQVDNPLTVLTQDLAREFLSSASNAKKYEFFAKGVQLEQLDQDYSLIAATNRLIEIDLQGKLESLNILKKNEEEAKRKLDKYERAQDHARRHRQLQEQMAWAQVVEAENLLAEKVAEVDEAVAHVAQMEQTMPNLENLYAGADESTKKAEEEVRKINSELGPLQTSLEAIKDELMKHITDVSALKTKERDLKPMITSLRKEREQQVEKINAEEERLSARDGGHHRRLQEGIDKTTAEIEKLGVEEKELRSYGNQLKQDYTEAQQKLAEASSALRGKEEELRGARITLQSIRNDTADTLSAYSNEHPRLLKAIEHEHGWIQKPIGPIGRCVTLKKEQWWSVVEKFFGATFSAFLCTNNHDANILRGLIHRNGCKGIQVLVMNADRMEAIQEPAERFDTILRVLEIPDDRVRRQLIVAHSAEQAVLIEDPEEAKEEMRKAQKGDNIALIFALNQGWGAKISKRGIDPVKPYNGRTRMCKSRAEEEKSAQDRIHTLESELDRFRQQAEAANKLVKDVEDEVRRIKKQVADLRVAIQKAQEQKEELIATLQEASDDGKLPQLQAQLEVTEHRLSVAEAHFQDFVTNKDKVNIQGKEIKARQTAAAQDVDLCKQRLEEAKVNLEDISRVRMEYLRRKNSGIQALEEAKREVEARRGAQQGQQDAVDEIIEQASSICDRVEVPAGETSATLDAKLEESQIYLDALSRELGGSEEELAEAYQKALEEYKQADYVCRGLGKLLNLLHQTLLDRRQRWKDFLQAISARARSQFLFLMSLRAFKGRLRLDHTQKELIIEVQPGLNEDGNRGPKGLSGGEKSLSTICLLLSLWEAMGSPIRCLDEFDVFMDPVNRDFSVTMMVDAARRAIGKQFILITPQTMTKLPEESDQVRIFKMPEPQRGNQTTIDRYIQR